MEFPCKFNLRSMKIFHNNHTNGEEDKNENNHDISNMLSNIGIILDQKVENNNKSIVNKEKFNYDLMGRVN